MFPDNSTEPYESVRRRRDDLLRQTKFLKAVLWACMLLIAGVAGMSCQSRTSSPAVLPDVLKAKTVQAEKFILEDDKKRMQALLTTTDEGASLLLLGTDRKESLKLGLTVTNEGAVVSFYDNDNKATARLAQRKIGPILTFLRADGRPYMALGASGNSPALAFLGPGESWRTELSLNPDMQKLLFFDEESKPRLGLLLTKKGPIIELVDKSGLSIFGAP